eukprot:3064208-Alexandrium_andersonii.AAC.1
MVIAKVWGCVVANSAKTQAFVAQPSAEAELTGVHRGVQLGIFFQNLAAQYKINMQLEVSPTAALASP